MFFCVTDSLILSREIDLKYSFEKQQNIFTLILSIYRMMNLHRHKTYNLYRFWMARATNVALLVPFLYVSPNLANAIGTIEWECLVENCQEKLTALSQIAPVQLHPLVNKSTTTVLIKETVTV